MASADFKNLNKVRLEFKHLKNQKPNSENTKLTKMKRNFYKSKISMSDNPVSVSTFKKMNVTILKPQ